MAADILAFPDPIDRRVAPPGVPAGLDALREAAALIDGRVLPPPRGERACLVRLASLTIARIAALDAGAPGGGQAA